MTNGNVKKDAREEIVFDGMFWIDKNGVKRRYVNPLYDEGFKILFGSEGNEELLIDLLNKVLPGREIRTLKHCNTEHHGMTESDGNAIFDVYCEDVDGVRFLVEMQNWSQHYFNKRAVYYSSFAIQDQAAKEKRHQLKTLGKDKWDYNFAPVYLVCLLTFNMKRSLPGFAKVKEDDYISIYKYTDVETNELLGDGTTLIFIELKKFCKNLQECRSEKEKWMCSLKSMGDQLEMPEELAGTILETAYEKAALAAMPPELRTIYISKAMSRNDELNSRAEMIEDALKEGYAKGRDEGLAEGVIKGKEEGREEGLAEGREKGMAEGKSAEKLENARKMKELGIDIETIMQVTGLDRTAVGNL